MWHKNHIIRKSLVPFVVLSALLGGGVAPAIAEDGPGALDSRSGGGTRLINGDPRGFGAEVFTGEAFDTCLAPSSDTMRAWHGTSPFGAAGVYIGGRARACPNQTNLDSDWVREVDGMGWKLLPIYVGSQAPCVASPRKHKWALSHVRPGAHGASEGRDAVRQAKELGMSAHSALYLDMETYDNTDVRCAATTLKFVQAWNRAVRKQGYVPGFYSSADSGIEHMEGARKAGHKDLPSMLWFARWRVPPSVDGEKGLNKLAWQPHRRIHQYDGDVQRTYGGHRLSIDRNAMDAPVAIIGGPRSE